MKMEEIDPTESSAPKVKAKTKNTATVPPPVPEPVAVPEIPAPVDEAGYYVVENLPTKMKLYPEGTVIKARPFKVPEIKMLSSMTEENANDLINDVLRRSVIGINIDDIYSADKIYILFWLRANTYKDSGYEVEFECGKCKKNSSYKFELDVLNIKDMDKKNYELLGKTMVTPDTKTEITFKLLTVKDENETEKFLKDNKNSLMNFDEEIVSFCKMIETINGKKMGMIEKYDYIISELTAQDYSYFESYIERISVGLEATVEVTCDKCGGSADAALPFQPSFFLPKVRTGRNIKDTI